MPLLVSISLLGQHSLAPCVAVRRKGMLSDAEPEGGVRAANPFVPVEVIVEGEQSVERVPWHKEGASPVVSEGVILSERDGEETSPYPIEALGFRAQC